VERQEEPEPEQEEPEPEQEEQQEPVPESSWLLWWPAVEL